LKKEIIALIFGMLMLLAIASPVLAENPNKVPVAVVLHASTWDLNTMDVWTAMHGQPNGGYDPEGGVVHLGYLHAWGTLDIYVDEVLIFPDVAYDDIITGPYNPTTMVGHTMYKEIWTLPGGTLEGIAHATSYGGDLLSCKEVVAKIVLQGTGDYAGQTLVMSYDWVKGVNTPIYEGYWLMP
jgi:hypothetical protein